MIHTLWVSLTRILARAYFYASYPFVITAFRWRERRQSQKLSPTRWLSSGELIRQDLEYFEGESADKFFSEEMLKRFSASRDSLKEKIVSANRINFTIFVFLIAQYVSIELDVTVFGVSINKAPGVTEALLSYLILSEFFISILGRSQYFLESTMKSIIDKITPEELRSIVGSQYFPLEQFGAYQSFNLPHIIPNALTRFLTLQTALFYLVAIIAPAIVLFYGGHILLIYDMWSRPQIGSVSKFLAVYLSFVLLINVTYSLSIRIRMPYRDWSHNQYIELTRQFHPQLLDKRLGEAWGALNRERHRLLDQGYSAVDFAADGPSRRLVRTFLVLAAIAMASAILMSP